MRKNKFSGFTLIELLVVITIIGILAVGGVSVYTSQMAKARDSTRLTDINSISTSVQTYNQENNQYPPKDSTVGTGSFKIATTNLRGITNPPKDPKAGDTICVNRTTIGGAQARCNYCYAVNGTGLNFKLSIPFEDESNASNKGLNDGGGSTRYEIYSGTGGTFSPGVNAGCAAGE